MSCRAATANGGKSVLPLLGALAFAWVVSGCITINIYFPAAAAEKAADRIIDEVLGKGSGGTPPPAQPQ
jgi:hypothetical protein